MNFRQNTFLFLLLLPVIFSCSADLEVKTANNYELIDLPDGSVAYLNKNSSITYQEDFSPRMVELDGEAYFEVVSAEGPFVVKTNLGEVEVVGTEFNVNSQIDEMEVEVAEGEVKFKSNGKSEKVKRGEKAIYNKTKKTFRKMKADLNFDRWMLDMRREFNKLGRDINRKSRKVQKGLNRMGKDIKKGSEKLGQELENEIEKLK